MDIDITLYSEQPLVVGTDTFDEGILNISNDELNCVHTSLCTEKRRRICEKEKMCQKYRPQCDADVANLLNMSMWSSKFRNMAYGKRLKSVNRILRKEFKKCKKLILHVSDGKMELKFTIPTRELSI